jgi:hypothetical protein
MSKKNKPPMSEDFFNNRRKYLLEELNKYILENKHKNFAIRLREILSVYNYNNRLEKKGFLGHVIVDQAPNLSDTLFDSLIEFDHNIR